MALLALTLLGGVAMADRHDRRGNWGDRGDRRWDRGDHRRDHRRDYRRDNRRVYRSPVYVNNGYYRFNNGYSHRYARPVFQQRYYDYRYRPQLIVENYQPVTGYVWVNGRWDWNGYEWTWISGHYVNDPTYNEPQYQEPTWDPARGNYYPQY